MRGPNLTAGMSLIAGVLLALTAPSSHAVWQWMRGAALTEFEDSDWDMLKATARQVLNGMPDGEQVNWTNPETGNRGSIIAVETFTHEGSRCRRAAMRNIAVSGQEGRATYNLCQQSDGDWIYLSPSALRQPVPETPSPE